MTKSSVIAFLKQNFVASAIFLLILSTTFLVYYKSKIMVTERRKAFFALRVSIAKRAIESRIIDYSQILKGAKGFVEASDTITGNEWKMYSERLEIFKHYPGILGLGYAIRVNPIDSIKHIRKVRESGLSEYKIFPPGKRDSYTSIVFIEPFDSINKRALGYDMFSEPVRRKAMQIARDSDEPAITGKVILIQELKNTQPGFLLFLPVYDSPPMAYNIVSRKNHLRGYVYCPFRASDFFEHTLRERFKQIDIEVFDGEKIDKDNLLYDKDSLTSYFRESSIKEFSKTERLEIAGHKWTIYYSSLPMLGISSDQYLPDLLLYSGILISILIFALLITQSFYWKSNNLRQTIIENASSALFLLDNKGFCTYMNPSAEELTGYKFNELKNKYIYRKAQTNSEGSRLFKADDRIETDLISGRDLKGYEDKFISKDGTVFPVNIYARPIIEKGVQVASIIEVIDISIQKKSQEFILLQAKVLDSLAEGVCVTDERGLIVYTNHTFNRMFVKEPNDLYKKNIRSLSLVNRSSLVSILKSLKQSGVWQGEFDYLKDESKYITIKSHISTLQIDEKCYRILVKQDVTAEKKYREDLKRFNEELSKTNSDLDNFIYIASHDLKAPISNFEGLINSLKDSLTREILKDEIIGIHFNMINKSILRMKETIIDLADINKAQRSISEQIESVDVCLLIKEIEDEMGLEINLSNSKIIMDLKSCPIISFSKVNLKSIIYNLLSNAIKFKPQERTPEVIIETKEIDKYYIIRISDNGIGIKAEYITKLFGIFKRFNPEIEGTGVGLYIVKRIIDNAGGKIEVHSLENIGSTFIVYLPKKE